VLFTGTLRFNLTPFGEHSDAECWAALRRAHLAGVAEASPLGLDLVLREGGAPLSAGQKQLVALAHALLRHSKAWPGRGGCPRHGCRGRAPPCRLRGFLCLAGRSLASGCRMVEVLGWPRAGAWARRRAGWIRRC